MRLHLVNGCKAFAATVSGRHAVLIISSRRLGEIDITLLLDLDDLVRGGGLDSVGGLTLVLGTKLRKVIDIFEAEFEAVDSGGELVSISSIDRIVGGSLLDREVEVSATLAKSGDLALLCER